MLDDKAKKLIMKMYVRGMTPEEIFLGAEENELETLKGASLEEINTVVRLYEGYLLEEYGCERNCLKYAREIESIKELEKQAWVRKAPSNIVELKRMKVRLMEIIRSETSGQMSIWNEIFKDGSEG